MALVPPVLRLVAGLCATWILLLGFSQPAWAGRVHPALESQLGALPPGGTISVIVEDVEAREPGRGCRRPPSQSSFGTGHGREGQAPEAGHPGSGRSPGAPGERAGSGPGAARGFALGDQWSLGQRHRSCGSAAGCPCRRQGGTRGSDHPRASPAPACCRTGSHHLFGQRVEHRHDPRARRVGAPGLQRRRQRGRELRHRRGRHPSGSRVAAIVATTAISWFDPYGEHARPYDQHGHGTHTTGIAVGGDARRFEHRCRAGREVDRGQGLGSDDGTGFVSAFHQIFEWFLAPGGDAANAPDVVNDSWALREAGCFTEFRADIQASGPRGSCRYSPPETQGRSRQGEQPRAR